MTIQEPKVLGKKSFYSTYESRQSCNVLCVEDCKLTRTIYKAIFKPFDEIEVSFAKSQSQALKLVLGNTYDYVITDYNLGDGNADLVIKEIRGLSEETPILLVTSHSAKSEEVGALSGYKITYSHKPISRGDLLSFLGIVDTPKIKKQKK